MSDDLVKRLRSIDQFSVEDCFLQSYLYEKAADRIEALEDALEKADALADVYEEEEKYLNYEIIPFDLCARSDAAIAAYREARK